jgi:hypothetical protein
MKSPEPIGKPIFLGTFIKEHGVLQMEDPNGQGRPRKMGIC